MFQSDPIDAEIGREALRRVFGILADEDPPQLPVTRLPQATVASAEAPPVALGPAGTALGSAGRSAAVAPAGLSRPEPAPEIAAAVTAPIVVPAPIVISASAERLAAAGAKPASTAAAASLPLPRPTGGRRQRFREQPAAGSLPPLRAR